ncbi:hypothetical protein MES4922_40084 [Mesorhizobium ventifaucium]|uniref:Uncharacterized protein n=1 Tax=Mesorhizobium ventifaucium TaxID=666020 RepID=A0ABM9E7Q4_9HYPH|nr:hypothetical protein MES4922_40084 [Mesorhizobium ventifaucium]
MGLRAAHRIYARLNEARVHAARLNATHSCPAARNAFMPQAERGTSSCPAELAHAVDRTPFPSRIFRLT